MVMVMVMLRLTGHPRVFGSQRQQRIALGAGEQAPAMFPQEQRDEEKDQPEAEENRNRYYRHAWNE